jgi:hypothetical protein
MIELMKTRVEKNKRWVFAFPQAVGVAVMKIKSFGLTVDAMGRRFAVAAKPITY